MEKNTLISQTVQFITKSWFWGLFIIIGLLGKFGLDLVQQRKKSFMQVLGQTLVAGFVGYLASIYCMQHYPPLPGSSYSPTSAIIVPITTLISDRIALFLIGIDWHPVLTILTGKSSKTKDKN